MYYFGDDSEAKLATCHKDIDKVLRTLIQFYDVKIVWGYRNEEQQNQAYDIGNSRLRYPDSNHNKKDEDGHPRSLAVDIAPYHSQRPHIRWYADHEFTQLAGRVLQIADLFDIQMLWGGDWDMDNDLYDQTFMDLGHYELVNLLL